MKTEDQNGRAKREVKTEDVCPSKKGKLDLDSLRDQINDANEKTGPEYWRSLEELAGSPSFQEA
ncbi:MAG: TAT-variant-translocated molybdopterin oxidoreductase, partial [Candidatus Sulfotelmatobacter sp.]